jgi:hypothetical protein
MKLGDYLDPLATDVAFWLAGIKSPDYPFEALGDVSLEVCTKLRSVAIMVLLVRADTDLFLHNLIRSGIVREDYLRRCHAEKRTGDHHCVSGRPGPLFDAIAGGDLALAGRIGALVPAAFQAGREYEDDFCYAQALHRFVRPSPPEAEIPPLLDQFERYLDGKSSSRLDLCRALASRDQAAFERAFDALLDERSLQIAADKKRGELEEPPVVAQRQVFVEGLAVLRIAGLRGLRTKPDYPYCPSLARLPMRTPFPGE